MCKVADCRWFSITILCVSFYKFSDRLQTWKSPTLQSTDWPISRQYHRPQMRKRVSYPEYKYIQNYVFPQCAELAERLEEGDIFPPVEEIVCPLLFGAALHIQVTIIMVRCVFCHLGDFLSNWVAWSLCLSMDYSLAYCALFCTAFPVSYYNLLSSCVVMVGQFSYSILLHVTISSTLVILNV